MPDETLTTAETAELLGRSPRTLEGWRTAVNSPRHRPVPQPVVTQDGKTGYDPQELVEHIHEHPEQAGPVLVKALAQYALQAERHIEELRNYKPPHYPQTEGTNHEQSTTASSGRA
jgi:hypothetical protein